MLFNSDSLFDEGQTVCCSELGAIQNSFHHLRGDLFVLEIEMIYSVYSLCCRGRGSVCVSEEDSCLYSVTS